MICRSCCRLLVAGLVLSMTAATAMAESRYARVASGKPPAHGETRIYTNSDLKKMFGIVDEEDLATPAAETTEAGVAADAVEDAIAVAPAPPALDPLSRMQQQQAARKQHRIRIAEAQAAVDAARANLAALEVQAAASKNPFGARPKLSDEEKEARRTTKETASQRFERTQQLVEQAREALHAAEAGLKKLQVEGP